MLSKKKKRGKMFFVKTQAGFLRLPDSVRYQFLLFRKTIQRYFRSVFFSFKRKLTKLQNVWNNIYSIENLAKQSIITGRYFKEVKADLKAKTEELCGTYFNVLQNTRIGINLFVFNLKKQTIETLNRELTILKNTSTPLTFKPALAIQGALVFSAFLFFAITIQTIIFPPSKPNTANLIKQQSIIVKQTAPVVAGQTANVKWTAIIKKSDITSPKNLLLLSKSAKNIKILTITKQQAEAIANAKIPDPATTLTLQDRKKLAGIFSIDLAGINFKSTNTAGLMEVKELVFRVLSSINSFFLADLEQSAANVVETITEQIIPPSVDEPPTTETPESVVVDLSEEAPAETKEEKKAAKEDKKQEAKQDKEDKNKKQGNAEAQNTGETQNSVTPDLSAEAPLSGAKADAAPISAAETSAVTETPAAETPVSESEQTPTAASAPSEQQPAEETQITEPEIPSPSSAESNTQQPTPSANGGDYVAVTYETPAPTITEQETKDGKLVTVSSGGAEKVDCLNSTTDQSMVLSAAGLLNGFTNAINSIVKFFTADLEQAVSEIKSEILNSKSETNSNSENSKNENKEEKQEDKETKDKQDEQDEQDEQDKEEKEEAKEENQGNIEPSAKNDQTQNTEAEPITSNDAIIPTIADVQGSGDQNTENSVSSEVAPTAETEEPKEAGPLSAPSAEAAAEAAYQSCLTQQTPITNVLAHTTIPEIYKVGQENLIKIKWKNNNDQEVAFTALDLNNNGKIDYLEWTVPHLSDQIFEIIFISKAFKLNQNKEIIEDIYDLVRYKDNQWATLQNNQYVRVTFEKILTNQNDITLYARSSSGAVIEVYPVYSDGSEGNQLIATFQEINQENFYKVLLTNLQTPTDVFDLKVVGSPSLPLGAISTAVDIDFIVDANRYWVGSAGGNTNDTANWSSTDPSSCTGGGASVPGTADIAIFDADCDNNATINADFSVLGIDIKTGYTGIITQSASTTVTVTTSSFVQADGTFTDAGNATTNIDLNDGSFTLSGGVFSNTGATSSFNIERNLTVSGGTFTNTSNTITFDDTNSADDSTITCTGSLGGTVVITKDGDSDFINASGCSIELGANPTTTIDDGAATDFDNNGTITIASGTWTVNGTGVLNNDGVITHSGTGWDMNNGNGGLTNNAGATITYAGTAITLESSLTQNGTFDLTGKTVTFDDTGGTDDTTITCTGSLGGTVVITKDTYGDFINASGCSINLGASPTTTISDAITNFDNNGTITIASGTWTVNGSGVINNDGTITHSGTGWDMNDTSLTNNTGATITYAGTALTIERSFTQNGTFSLSGITVTFDDTSGADDSTITCTGTLGGTMVITKNSDGDFINASGCSISLGASPTTTIDSDATTDFDNNGTVTIASGTWTITGTTSTSIINNDGTITHSGNGWDFNDASLTNNSGATITYAGTAITIERDFTQSGTFNLSGITVTFDGVNSDATAITCTGSLGGIVLFNKAYTSGTTNNSIASGCSVSLGASPTWTLGGAGLAAFTNNGTMTIDSGTWTVNGGGGSTITNAGTITHSGTGWDINDASLTNNSGATITYAGTAITMERSFTQNGTFNLSGITVTFDGVNSDATAITCSGSLGGTVLFNKAYTSGTTNNSIASGCSVSLGASPTWTLGGAGLAAFTNNGTMTIDSGTWTVNGGGGSTITNAGTITHSGTGWDINDASLTNNSGATITYAGTAITMERSFTQNGTFNLSGITVTFDDSDTSDNTTLTCGSTISGNITIVKDAAASTPTFGLGGSCTVTGNFTRTDGVFSNPGSAMTLTIQGNLSISTTDTFGGTNLTLTMGGSGTQTITQNAGTMSGVFKVDKSGGSASLSTNFTTGTTCNVVEDTFAITNKTFACGSTFTVEDGGNFQRAGNETTTTPTLNSGSTVTYVGDGDAAADTITITTMAATYHHLTINSTDGATDTFNIAAAIDVNGAFTITAGAVTASGNAMTVGGNWSNSGTFTHGNNTVTLDGTSQSVSGSTTFYNLTKSVTSADTLTFTAGTTQTVSNTLTLNGASGQLLSLRSSSTPTQWSINPQGTRTLSYLDVKDSNNTNATAINMAGTNSTNSGNNTNWTFDTTAPTTSATATAGGSSYTFGSWTTSNVAVTLTCDDGSGVGCASGYPKYCTDTTNTCTATTTYSTPVTISTEGTSYIRYYSTDTVPNTETTNSSTIKIDTTAPASGSITYTDGYYTSASVSTTYSTGTDSGAGLNNATGKIQRAEATLTAGSCGSYGSFSDLVTEYDGSYTDTTVATAKCYKYQYLIQDTVANQATYTSANVAKVDTATPDIVAVDAGASSSDRISLTSNTWFKYTDTGSDDQVSFSWTDPSSASDDTFYYELNASSGSTITGDESTTTNPYIDSITIAEGTNYFHVRPKNGAETWGTERTFIVKYDKTVPTTSDDFTHNDSWQNGNQTITLTPADATSGVSWTKYCQDTANTCEPSAGTSYTVPVVISTEGTSYFRYASQDNAGNTQTTQSKTVKIDTTDPITTADAGSYTFGSWTGSNVTVTLTCVDTSGSGCSTTYYCTDATNTCTPTAGTLYTVPVTVSAEGTTYFRYASTDFVGHTNTTQSQTIKITHGPSFTSGPSDNGSSSTSPKNVGSAVTFTATATEIVSNDYYLAICKTNSITPNDKDLPTCGGGNWCISSAAVSGVSAQCAYTTLAGDAESNDWYAFVCSDATPSQCSAMSQGTGNNGSPFKVNHVPIFSAIADSPDPVSLASQITFTPTSSDSDTDGTADTVTLYVCKSNDFTGSACGAAGEWCSSTASASNPTCSYTVVSGDGNTSHNYYGYIIDNHSLQSSSNPRSSTFTTSVDEAAPTTTATATAGGSSYTFGNWTTSNVAVTLTCSDGSGVGCASGYPKYCADTTNTCTATTTYSSAVTISTEGTSYIRYYSTDTVPNTETTKSSTIKIDTAVPITVISTIRNGNEINTTLTCTDTSGSGCTYIYYCADTTNTCTPTTIYTATVHYYISSKTYFRYYSVDAMSGAGSTASEQIDLVGETIGTGPAPQPAPTPVLTPAPAPTTVIQQVAEQVVQVPQQIVQQITDITKQLAKTPQQLAQNIQIISQKVSDVSKQIAELIILPFGGGEPKLQGLGPLAEAVPKEAPFPLKGWDIMTTRPIGGFALSPVKSDISFFADKIPRFKETLTALGIDVNSISSAQKVSGVELYFPGLTQLVLTEAEILEINKFEIAKQTVSPELTTGTEKEQKGLVGPGTFEINKFALAQAVPLADLTPKAKQKIPSDIVFVRAGGELIDYNVAISVDKNGGVEQKIKTISGQPIQLVIKSDQPAKRVTGFISLKKSAIGRNSEPSKVLGFISRISGAALIASMQDVAQQKQEEGLLVNKFAYAESGFGIYTASITAPKNEGEYEISTVIEYKDILLAPKEAKLTAIVNPEGYVYSQFPDGRLRVKGASVLLYWLNPETKQYEIWPAEKFLQRNPIVTDETGKYSFLVPKGTYKLKTTALSYENYESDSFEMNEEIAVSQDIELKKKTGLLGWFNWQNIIVALLIVVIVLLCVIIVFFLKRSKNS